MTKQSGLSGTLVGIVACPFCDALPGQMCKQPSGRGCRAHAARRKRAIARNKRLLLSGSAGETKSE